MAVGIVDAGNDRLTFEVVAHVALGRCHLLNRADGHDLVVAHEHGLGPRRRIVGGEYVSVVVVGVRGHLALPFGGITCACCVVVADQFAGE